MPRRRDPRPAERPSRTNTQLRKIPRRGQAVIGRTAPGREQRARQQVEKERRLKGDLLEALAHELRSPLNAVLGWAHLLRAGQLEPETLARGLEIICRNAELQGQLITEVLDLSRTIAGKLSLDVKPLDLVSVVQAALDQVRPSAEDKGLRLEAALDADAGVSGDPHRLTQILRILMANAIGFTSGKGSVHVTMRRDGSHLEVEVSADNCDILPDVLVHVFDGFREESSSMGVHGYGGLGLALARYLTELHGGTVAASGPGEGRATFTLRLPLVEVRRQSQPGDLP